MRLGIRAKQIAGVTAIVGLSVVALSGLAVERICRFLLEESITRAKIRAATPLSQDVLDDVVRTFSTITGRQVVATVEIAPELIGGIIVEVEGRVYDGSLRTELDKMQHQMATGS